MSFSEEEKKEHKLKSVAKYRATDKGKLTNERNQQNFKEKNPNYFVEWNLNKRYGITLDQWNSLFEQQKGKCAVCGRSQSELNCKFHLDHDHNTGKIRGLLCTSCNIALGDFRVDEVGTDILYRAVEYIEKVR